MGSKLKILMLHGYRQNEAIFKDKTGGVRKKLKFIDFVYCEAPNLVPKSTTVDEPVQSDSDTGEKKNGADASSSINQIKKCWFLKWTERPTNNSTAFIEDFEKTLDYLDQVFAEKGPFDGIWGFSQGATVSYILCKLLNDGQLVEKRKNIRFNFAIISATCQGPHEPEFDGYYDIEKKISIPSLHLIGKSDWIIPYEKSLEMTKLFVEPTIYIHESGHYIPRTSESKEIYTNFLLKMSDLFNKKS
jgi:hypothetical protein